MDMMIKGFEPILSVHGLLLNPIARLMEIVLALYDTIGGSGLS